MRRLVCLLWSLILALTLTSCRQIMESSVKRQMSRTRVDLLSDDRLNVVLIGSGGPMPNAERISTSLAIFAGSQFILVDTGPGAARSAMLQNLPIGRLSAVLLTHFHSDHIADLGEVNLYSWIQGRRNPLAVFGPPGVERVVDGFAMAYAQDAGYRTAHHGDQVAPASAAKPIAIPVFPETADQAKLVFERNGLRAYMFLVDHFPAVPAVGYRVEYRDQVVVISGDTKKTETLAQHVAQADLFFCDALNAEMIGMVAKVATEINQPLNAKIMTDIPDYHLTPVQAAEVAQAAGVKKLVFYHVVPPLTNWLLKRMYLEGVADIYGGDIVVGEDGMTFVLEAN